MSEYQYYEFLAIDRPLSEKAMDAVRSFSTRADISPTRFVNEYHWGSFRGSPEKFLHEWFDVMLYLANWGTHRFMCQVPIDLIDVDYAKECCAGDFATLKIVDASHALFDFEYQPDDGGDWQGDDDGAGFMASIAPIRAELIAGDNRPLYLAWLLCAQFGQLDDDELEPIVPLGLKQLSTAQVAFADFLNIDDDLIATAAMASPPRDKSPAGFENWLRALPVAEKDALLLSLLNGTDAHANVRLRRRFSGTAGKAASTEAAPRRKVADLLAAMEAVRTRREEHERELAAQARARKKAADEAARTAYLNDLGGREEQSWKQIDTLIGTKTPKNYEESVRLLRDLHDLNDRRQSPQQFISRLHRILEQHSKKPSLIERIQKAGLLGDVRYSA